MKSTTPHSILYYQERHTVSYHEIGEGKLYRFMSDRDGFENRALVKKSFKRILQNLVKICALVEVMLLKVADYFEIMDAQNRFKTVELYKRTVEMLDVHIYTPESLARGGTSVPEIVKLHNLGNPWGMEAHLGSVRALSHWPALYKGKLHITYPASTELTMSKLVRAHHWADKCIDAGKLVPEGEFTNDDAVALWLGNDRQELAKVADSVNALVWWNHAADTKATSGLSLYSLQALTVAILVHRLNWQMLPNEDSYIATILSNLVPSDVRDMVKEFSGRISGLTPLLMRACNFGLPTTRHLNVFGITGF